jgi:OHCU decarboxylase
MSAAVSSALERLNALPPEAAEESLLSCCGSREWARRVAAGRPFRRPEELEEAADRIWRSLSEEDWREAFGAHPRIGESAPSANRSGDWSRQEQAGASSASPETLANLADVNREYEQRFGHVFIVCATGKSAAEMLAQALERLHNGTRTELVIAAEEQRRIMRLRLAKMLDREGS